MTSPLPTFELDERKPSQVREYGEVGIVVGLVTIAALFMAPKTHISFGIVYLIAVVTLSMRVGRGPVIFAAILSALTWDLFVIPPVGSFVISSFDDVMMLGTYCIVAFVTGRSNARIRGQQRTERARERITSALLEVARALAEPKSIEQTLDVALEYTDHLIKGRSAILLTLPDGRLQLRESKNSPYVLEEAPAAEKASREATKTGRYTKHFQDFRGHYIPLVVAQNTLGVLAVYLPSTFTTRTGVINDLLDDLAAQIAMQIECEQLRVISERERLLVESEKLHRSLLDSVSHELRTPLAVLKAATDKFATLSEPARGDLIPELQTATARLNRLVANLLNLNRLESGALKPKLDWCDLRVLISDALRNTKDETQNHSVTVVIPPGLVLVYVDLALTEQAITNLLHNAASHTPSNTKIKIIGEIEEGVAPRLCISVIDDGPGLPPELKGALFQKFQRGKQARAGGLGLGLSIVRGFVTAQKGEIIADNNPDGGARFTIYLPHQIPKTVPEE